MSFLRPIFSSSFPRPFFYVFKKIIFQPCCFALVSFVLTKERDHLHYEIQPKQTNSPTLRSFPREPEGSRRSRVHKVIRIFLFPITPPPSVRLVPSFKYILEHYSLVLRNFFCDHFVILSLILLLYFVLVSIQCVHTTTDAFFLWPFLLLISTFKHFGESLLFHVQGGFNAPFVVLMHLPTTLAPSLLNAKFSSALS